MASGSRSILFVKSENAENIIKELTNIGYQPDVQKVIDDTTLISFSGRGNSYKPASGNYLYLGTDDSPTFYLEGDAELANKFDLTVSFRFGFNYSNEVKEQLESNSLIMEHFNNIKNIIETSNLNGSEYENDDTEEYLSSAFDYEVSIDKFKSSKLKDLSLSGENIEKELENIGIDEDDYKLTYPCVTDEDNYYDVMPSGAGDFFDGLFIGFEPYIRVQLEPDEKSLVLNGDEMRIDDF